MAVDQKKKLARIVEVINLLRATPDDKITLALTIELKKLANPKTMYPLCQEYIDVLRESAIKCEQMYGPINDIAMKIVEERRLPESIRDMKRFTNDSLSMYVNNGIHEIEIIRGKCIFTDQKPDYSNVFSNVLPLIRENGLYGEIE